MALFGESENRTEKRGKNLKRPDGLRTPGSGKADRQPFVRLTHRTFFGTTLSVGCNSFSGRGNDTNIDHYFEKAVPVLSTKMLDRVSVNAVTGLFGGQKLTEDDFASVTQIDEDKYRSVGRAATGGIEAQLGTMNAVRRTARTDDEGFLE